MCRQSLINYLFTALNGDPAVYEKIGNGKLAMFGNEVKTGQLDLLIECGDQAAISIKDIETLILHGESIAENDARVAGKGKETDKYKYQMPESIRNNAEFIDRKLAEIKICDPAIGSGAFPVGMMSEIVKARSTLTIWIKTGDRSPYHFKRECIESSLYGVDIDPGAVEIAKLRLWLSLVVDEEDIKQIKPLPNLDYKIVRGNSLIGFPENMNSALEKEIESLEDDFFDETNTNIKNRLRATIDAKIQYRYANWKIRGGCVVDFDFRTVFSKVFRAKGGFDVVIGNPPYVRQEQIKEYKPVFKDMFACFTGVADLYVYFYEKGLSILNPAGVLTFISSDKYFRSGYGEKLRGFIGEKKRILQLIDFGDAPVFDAIAYPCIAIIQNAKPNENGKIRVFTWEEGLAIEDFDRVIAQKGFAMPQSELRADGWRLESNETLRLLDKLRKVGKPLGEYVEGKFYRGILTGLNEAFVVDRETRDRLIVEHKSSAEVPEAVFTGKGCEKVEGGVSGFMADIYPAWN